MKKYLILAIIVIIAVSAIAYLFANYKLNNMQAEENNKIYANI